MTPTQRTLKALREKGYVAAVTEKWNPYARIRQDLFGFIDGVALKPNEILGWQACAGSSVAAHVTKIREVCTDAAGAWLAAGGRIQVWGWRKVKVKRGMKAMRWEPRVVELETTTT